MYANVYANASNDTHYYTHVNAYVVGRVHPLQRYKVEIPKPVNYPLHVQ